MAETCPLLELSHELLHHVFVDVDHPSDLARLSLTCRELNNYIRGNRLLHKEIYVDRYDEPRETTGTTGVKSDWESWLHDMIRLERLLEGSNRYQKQEELEYAYKHIMRLIETADPPESKNMHRLRHYFQSPANVDTFLCSSSLFARAGNELQRAAQTDGLRQASAKLHCMYGVPIDPVPSRLTSSYQSPDASLSPSRCTRLQMRPYPTHTYARSKVYDLREYTDATLWGPFKDDGQQRVDWEKVEAIMIVLGFNLNRFTERSEGRWQKVWDTPFEGANPNSYHPILPATTATTTCNKEERPDSDLLKIRSLAATLDSQDPYGVTGTWMRVVCFLDYSDLYAFNFLNNARLADGEPRPPVDTEEGLIDLAESIKLQVTKIVPPSDSHDDEEGCGEEEGLDWSGFVGTRLPTVHFRGSSRSLHASWDPNANSKIRGTVRQTPEGEIRWTTFSIFHGEERWRSEGIQVGGLRSARGVLGNWFDKDHNIHGPAGPTAFWKVTDELEEERNSSTPVAYH
ncbi:hypothetical protein LTR62_005989 [Meristemomyces frigidus]|uniref:F-box domain-containing protein n=1 Tax=Meristemomyces frigidus TaxID=1508187 RepID=A0AAN7TP33_9PEZI|nr:hypothetical protein LTR62_005989 [Meristemomyces frigidus]